MTRKSHFSMMPPLIMACAASYGSEGMVNVNPHTTLTSSTGVEGNSTAQATMRGKNGAINLNGDRVELKEGKLTVNGTSYGSVDAQSIVKYTVKGKEKKLWVDGVERSAEGS